MKTAFCYCLLAGLILFQGLWSESQILPSSDAGQTNILLKGSVVANNIQTAIAGHLALDRKRPEFPSGMTAGLRTTMSSWVMSGR